MTTASTSPACCRSRPPLRAQESEETRRTSCRDSAGSEKRERARQLLSHEIAFIPHPSFRRTSAPNDRDTDFSEAALPRFGGLGETPLLSREQEQAFFRRMNWLKYRANAVRSTLDANWPDVQAMDEAERLLKEAQTLRDQIVLANLRLVMTIVKRYANSAASFDDLFSDGVMTLLKAVEKFDFSRGFRFSTYAYRAIMSGVFRALSVRAARERRLTAFSESKHDFGAAVPPAEPDVPALRSSLRSLMTHLTPRERFVLLARFPLDARRKPRTFQSLADELGLSKERVRQLEHRALAKLRHQAEEAGLDDFFETPSDEPNAS